jgi:hypothetical protein
MTLITTTRGLMEEDRLCKSEYLSADTDDLRTVWTEYCELGCPGPAHVTGIPDRDTVFCQHHLHHSVHVTMKRWPEGMLGTALGQLGG